MPKRSYPLDREQQGIRITLDGYTIDLLNEVLGDKTFVSPSAAIRASVQHFVAEVIEEREKGNLKKRDRVIVPQKNLAKLFLQAKTPLNALHHYFCFALLQINFTIRSLFQFLQVGWRERLTFGNPVRR